MASGGLSFPHFSKPIEIPQDVYLDILSFLDKPSIAVCTLLSHPWRVSAQQELFREIKLRCYDEARSIPNFLAFIESGDAQAVVAHVKTLVVLGRPGGTGGDKVFEMTTYDIHRLLIRFHALQKITLYRVLLHGTPEKSLSLPPLIELRLILSTFLWPQWLEVSEEVLQQSARTFSCGFTDLLKMFPHIGTLVVDRIYVQWDAEHESAARSGRAPPEILIKELGQMLPTSLHPDKLVAYTGRVRDSTSHLRRGDLGIIEFLSALNPIKEVDIEGVAPVDIGGMGAGLRRLTASIDSGFGSDEKPLIYDLASCTNLTSLNVAVPDLVSASCAAAIVSTLVDCPQTTSHLTLEFTRYPWISLSFDNISTMQLLRWDALDKGLAARDGLISFNVIFPHGLTHPEAEYLDWIAEMPHRLPLLHARGSLLVVLKAVDVEMLYKPIEVDWN
ncbi:hypothetical protein EIP91_008054 [Steccherinum ochraceum]|uniref:F-box domain-containing protein n=1 Tax=Steccherinum ochraceum TaxID=92696 RepID=A0A4R0RUB0_9APHY|nr:hypothetical protein EIP91_008054 [Steccherinum ochraceum]